MRKIFWPLLYFLKNVWPSLPLISDSVTDAKGIQLLVFSCGHRHVPLQVSLMSIVTRDGLKSTQL